MKQFNLLFFFAFIALFIACDKKEPSPPEPPETPQLTPITMEGKETLSFLKDGEVWIADKDAFSPVATITLASKQFSMDSRKRWDTNQQEFFTLSFILSDFNKKKYIESDTYAFGGGFYPELDLGIYCRTPLEPITIYESYRLNELDTFNFVDVTYLDWSGTFNIISGTFQFRMINYDNEECQDTIYITDGRFDLEFDVI